MYRAVIVDDEPFMLEGMRLMVDWNRCGFALCGEATSAQDALRLVDTLRPHLLITDVRMPGMLGTDLASIVNRYHPEVMILFFSGFRDFTYAQSAIRSHAFGYLVKPIDTDEVHETLLRIKGELDARIAGSAEGGQPPVLLRDQVLRRVALGDDSPESLLRASVLMQIKRGDPCFCAVLARSHSPVPESLRLLLTTCGAVPFQLSPGQYGLGFRQIERDLPLLERLAAGLAETGRVAMSVGQVHRGPEGFGKSLREALDAQGVLFEFANGLRLYKAFDADTALWLACVQPSMLHDAAMDARPERLAEALATLRREAAERQPGMFALRYLAAAVDAMLPANVSAAGGSPLRALWLDEALTPPQWLDAFCATLGALQACDRPQDDAAMPAPVQAALAAIRQRYAQPLSIGSVAQELNMNPAYLGQLVRRCTGATFHRRLLATRIGHACVLLRQTAQPIGVVALAVGFPDVDYFAQQFRGRMGMSPIAYRSAETAKGEGHHAPHQ